MLARGHAVFCRRDIARVVMALRLEFAGQDHPVGPRDRADLGDGRQTLRKAHQRRTHSRLDSTGTACPGGDRFGLSCECGDAEARRQKEPQGAGRDRGTPAAASSSLPGMSGRLRLLTVRPSPVRENTQSLTMKAGRPRMRVPRASIVAIAAGILSPLAPSVALGSSSDDGAATRAYIDARYTFAHANAPNTSAQLSAMRALSGRVEGECPGVLAGARSLASAKQLQAITNEVLATITLAEIGPDRNALRATARKIRNLHWTDRKLTRLVRREDQEAKALASLPDPQLCTDLRAWAASSFRVLPVQTEHVNRELAVEVSEEGQGREEIIARRLRPYELPAEHRTVRRTAAIEARRNRATESTFLAAFKTISVATGLAPPEPPSSG